MSGLWMYEFFTTPPLLPTWITGQICNCQLGNADLVTPWLPISTYKSWCFTIATKQAAAHCVGRMGGVTSREKWLVALKMKRNCSLGRPQERTPPLVLTYIHRGYRGDKKLMNLGSWTSSGILLICIHNRNLDEDPRPRKISPDSSPVRGKTIGLKLPTRG